MKAKKEKENLVLGFFTIPVVASMHSESWFVGKKTTAGFGSDWTIFVRFTSWGQLFLAMPHLSLVRPVQFLAGY